MRLGRQALDISEMDNATGNDRYNLCAARGQLNILEPTACDEGSAADEHHELQDADAIADHLWQHCLRGIQGHKRSMRVIDGCGGTHIVAII